MHKSTMRIMMVEPLGDGGIAHYTYNLLNAFSLAGIDTILFTSKSYEFENVNIHHIVHNSMFRLAHQLIGKYPFLDKEAGLSSIIRRAIKIIEYPLNTLEALCLVASKKIKLIHLQSVNLIELSMVIAFRLINKKVVYTIHNVKPRHKQLRFYHVLLYRLMYMLCDRVIIHSKTGKEEIINLYGVDQSKIHVIPHGNYKFFIPEQVLSGAAAKSALSIDPKCKTILFFGAIRENKGLKNILLALPMIKDSIPDVKLLIVGEPWEDYKKYRSIISDKNLDGNVWERLAYVRNNDLPLFFSASDLVVLPYNEVTGSGVLQIAYAFGKPVVATDLGSFREAIEDGKNGYLVPLKDTQRLAEKCVAVLADDEKMKKLGDYSRYLADSRFSWDSIATETIRVYKISLAE